MLPSIELERTVLPSIDFLKEHCCHLSSFRKNSAAIYRFSEGTHKVQSYYFVNFRTYSLHSIDYHGQNEKSYVYLSCPYLFIFTSFWLFYCSNLLTIQLLLFILGMSSHVMSGQVKSCHVMSYHVMSCHVI